MTLDIVVPPVFEFVNVNVPLFAIPPVAIVKTLAVVFVILPPPAFTVKPLV